MANANDDESNDDNDDSGRQFDSSDLTDLDENGVDHSKSFKNRIKNQSLNKKKKLNMNEHQLNQNKTLLKYRINNSNNKLIERENSLEKIQGNCNFIFLNCL